MMKRTKRWVGPGFLTAQSWEEAERWVESGFSVRLDLRHLGPAERSAAMRAVRAGVAQYCDLAYELRDDVVACWLSPKGYFVDLNGVVANRILVIDDED